MVDTDIVVALECEPGCSWGRPNDASNEIPPLRGEEAVSHSVCGYQLPNASTRLQFQGHCQTDAFLRVRRSRHNGREDVLGERRDPSPSECSPPLFVYSARSLQHHLCLPGSRHTLRPLNQRRTRNPSASVLCLGQCSAKWNGGVATSFAGYVVFMDRLSMGKL